LAYFPNEKCGTFGVDRKLSYCFKKSFGRKRQKKVAGAWQIVRKDGKAFKESTNYLGVISDIIQLLFYIASLT